MGGAGKPSPGLPKRLGPARVVDNGARSRILSLAESPTTGYR